MNNSSLCAFSISFMILYISHLAHLKLQSSTLFNFPTPPLSHAQSLSIFMPFCKFLALSICGLVTSTIHGILASYLGAPQLCSLFYSEFSICSYNSVCLQLALGCIFKEPPSQLHNSINAVFCSLYCIVSLLYFAHCFVPVVSSNKPEPGLGSGH